MTSSIAAIPLALQLHRDVARIGLGNGGESHLEPGAPGGAFYLGGLIEDALDMLENPIGLGEGTSCGHDVVEDEAALVHLGQQVRAEGGVGEVGADEQNQTAKEEK